MSRHHNRRLLATSGVAALGLSLVAMAAQFGVLTQDKERQDAFVGQPPAPMSSRLADDRNPGSASKRNDKLVGWLGTTARQRAERVDSFIVSYSADGARLLSQATRKRRIEAQGRAIGMKIQLVRRTAVGADLIRIDRALDRKQAERFVREMLRDPDIRDVSANVWLQPLFAPNDPLYAQQWHYAATDAGINAEAAWDLSTGAGTVVAVIDTGITAHSDLDGNVIAGYDFIKDEFLASDGDGRDPDPSDPGMVGWHGTAMAGAVAAVSNNGNGIAGTAFGARIQPVRVLGWATLPGAGGTLADVVDAIVWSAGGNVDGVPANPTPADVLNMSFAAPETCSAPMQAAIDYATASGAVVVAAAGDLGPMMPADCQGVITVGATDRSGANVRYSAYSETIDVSAPGGAGPSVPNPIETNDILSTSNLGEASPGQETYHWRFGTSMATAQVSGVIALMRSAAQTPLSAQQAKRILINTAYARGFPSNCSWASFCGHGIVDARYAVAVAAGLEPIPADPPPLPAPAPGIPLRNGAALTGIAVAQDASLFYELDVPNGARGLFFGTSGGTGDADLRVRIGRRPSDADFECGSAGANNTESCFFPAPRAGKYFVRVKGFSAAEGISLYASFLDPGWARGLQATALSGKDVVHVTLAWKQGGQRVDVVRNGQVLQTVRNRGRYSDQFPAGGSGTMIYRICNAGTEECSNEASVAYSRRRSSP